MDGPGRLLGHDVAGFLCLLISSASGQRRPLSRIASLADRPAHTHSLLTAPLASRGEMATTAQEEGVPPVEAELRAELAALKNSELKKRARTAGVEAEALPLLGAAATMVHEVAEPGWAASGQVRKPILAFLELELQLARHDPIHDQQGNWRPEARAASGALPPSMNHLNCGPSLLP